MGGAIGRAREGAGARAGALGAVRAFFLLAGAGLGIAALSGAALSWDGAIYLFELLDKQRPYVSQGRLLTWPLHLPVIAASRATSDLPFLIVVFGLVYAAVPLGTLAACWWVVRGRAPALFVWPALAIGLGMLPGQFNFIAEGNIALQLVWPIALATLVGLPRRTLPLVGLLAVALFVSHPFAGALFAAAAAVAAAAGWCRPERRGVLWAGGAGFAALAAASAGRFWLTRTSYEDAQLSADVVRWTFAGSVAGLPLVALVATAVAALLIVAAPHAERRWPGGLARALRSGAVAAIGAGGLALIVWARDPVAWRLAKEYYRFALFALLPLLAVATLDALGRDRARSLVAEREARAREGALRALGAVMLVVLAVQSVAWLNVTSDLRAAINRSPFACVSLAPLGAIGGTALDDWPTAYLALLQQGRTPGRVVLPGDGCGTANLTEGVALNPNLGAGQLRPWETGWFRLGPLRDRLAAEQGGASGCGFGLTTGWHQTETNPPFWWRWSDGRDAQMRVTLDRPATVVLGGEIESATARNQVAVAVNGQRRATIDLPATGLRPLGPLSLQLPAGVSTIRLASQNGPVPAAADGRPLGLSVANLTLTLADTNRPCAFHP